MNITSLIDTLSKVLPVIAKVFVLIVVLAIAAWLARKVYNLLRQLRQNVSYLEITPPARTDRVPEATSRLFIALHGLGTSKLWYERLLGQVDVFSMEIVSTRKEGIRFIIRVASDKAETIKQSIVAYLPDAKVKTVDDYLPAKAKHSRILSFKQARHFAFPLQGHDLLESHDPIAYLTGAMTKLEDNELMSLQVVATPVRVHQAEALREKILHNEDLLAKLSGKSSSLPAVTTGINSALFGLTDIVSGAYHGPSKAQYQSAQRDLEYKKQVAKNIKPVRTLSYFEHELVESVHRKLGQPLFHTEVRVLLACDTKQEVKKRRKSVESALSLFTVPKYQNLRVIRTHYSLARSYVRYAFTKRLPSQLRASNIFSASELSSLFHFPHSVTAKTENVVKSLSRTLPAPVSLKNGTKLDIRLGKNEHHGSETPIGLTEDERQRHVYIIGGTGNGKTTMLLYSIVQDIQNGKGLAVLDPHGDLAETILRHIPEERIKDVIYLNPDDLTHPIGINLLELDPELTGDELLREKDLITESTISVLRKIFSEDDSGGHRIEYVLRNTIQTALTMEGATLFTIFRLLNDAKYRRGVVKGLQDEDLKNFWNNELGKAGEFQRVKMAAGITAKIGRFLFSASAKRMLEQEKSTIDFDNILDSGKILICNFSKGLLGEDTSTLFGTTVLAKLQVASLKRARQKQASRRSFYLYVDEFQNFATMSFVQMLSEARKYKLFLTMAEQSTSQQDQQRLVDIILANVGTVICFRSGSPADERLILPLFHPYIEQGEIANLPAYSFYCRIAAVHAQEPMSGITVLLDSSGDELMAKEAVNYSRTTYGVKIAPKAIEKPPQQEASAKKVVRTKAKSKTPSTTKSTYNNTGPM